MISFKALDSNGELINSKMKPFTYPAGEVSIKFEDSREFEKTELAIIQPEFGSIHNDLVSYLMWDNTLSNRGFGDDLDEQYTLILPYMPGAREDRGRVFGLDIYHTIIENNLSTENVVIFDPHSEVTSKLFRSGECRYLKTLTPAQLVSQRRYTFAGYDYVIAPDEGATERAQSVADVMGVPVVQIKKKRDFDTGKILGFEAPTNIDLGAKYLVVDDICDGGGTFLGLVEATGLKPTEIDLYVSHGVFSKGTEELKKKFGRIITTNSYLADVVKNGEVEVIDVIRPMIDLIK